MGLFSTEPSYAVPQQPTLENMQSIAYPDYRIQQTYSGTHTTQDNPNTVFLNEAEIKKAGIDKNQVLAHELQHQIGYLPEAKGQLETKDFKSIIDEAWMNNAKELKVDGREFYKKLQDSLSLKEVQNKLKELGAVEGNRVLEPKKTSLQELLADISAFETTTGKDLTKDPILSKYVFKDENLKQLYKSTTGLAGVVLGDSDYAPYSLEAAKAWGYKPPATLMNKAQGYITNLFYKDPFKNTTK